MRKSLQPAFVSEEPEPPFTRDEANALIAMIMRVDANLQLLLHLLTEDDGEEEEEEPDA
jgi:hypothetical protein